MPHGLNSCWLSRWRWPVADILDGFGGESLSVSLSQLTEQHAELSTEQAAFTAAVGRRLSVLEEWRTSTSEKRDQDPSLPTKVSSEEHVVLERSAEPTGRRVADEPLEGPSCHPSLWFCGAVVTRALIAKRSVADVLRDSSSRRCGRLFGFTRCVAIAGRMSCDKQRVAVRILSAPVVILRVGTEVAQAVFFEKAMLQSLGEAGSTYLTRGPLLVVRTRHVRTHSFRSLVTRFQYTVSWRLSRHVVVAPLPAASLLTDTRRSTVGPGTREDTTTESDEYMTHFTFAAFSMLDMYVAI